MHIVKINMVHHVPERLASGTWLRGPDSNRKSPGYGPGEMPFLHPAGRKKPALLTSLPAKMRCRDNLADLGLIVNHAIL